MTDQPRYLTLKQTALYINLPLDFVYTLSARNELPGLIRWGSRTLRVDRAQLDRWLADRIIEVCS